MIVVFCVCKLYFFFFLRFFKKIMCIVFNSVLMNSCEFFCRSRLNCFVILLMFFVNFFMLCVFFDVIVCFKCCEYLYIM